MAVVVLRWDVKGVYLADMFLKNVFPDSRRKYLEKYHFIIFYFLCKAVVCYSARCEHYRKPKNTKREKKSALRAMSLVGYDYLRTKIFFISQYVHRVPYVNQLFDDIFRENAFRLPWNQKNNIVPYAKNSVILNYKSPQQAEYIRKTPRYSTVCLTILFVMYSAHPMSIA